MKHTAKWWRSAKLSGQREQSVEQNDRFWKQNRIKLVKGRYCKAQTVIEVGSQCTGTKDQQASWPGRRGLKSVSRWKERSWKEVQTRVRFVIGRLDDEKLRKCGLKIRRRVRQRYVNHLICGYLKISCHSIIMFKATNLQKVLSNGKEWRASDSVHIGPCRSRHGIQPEQPTSEWFHQGSKAK